MSAPDVCPAHGVIDCQCILAPEDKDDLDDDTDPDFWPDGCDDEPAEEQGALAKLGQALRTIGEAAAITRPLEGSYYAVDQGARVQWLWSGGGARAMHAALARLFNANGIEALEVPGAGVWTAST